MYNINNLPRRCNYTQEEYKALIEDIKKESPEDGDKKETGESDMKKRVEEKNTYSNRNSIVKVQCVHIDPPKNVEHPFSIGPDKQTKDKSLKRFELECDELIKRRNAEKFNTTYSNDRDMEFSQIKTNKNNNNNEISEKADRPVLMPGRQTRYFQDYCNECVQHKNTMKFDPSFPKETNNCVKKSQCESSIIGHQDECNKVTDSGLGSDIEHKKEEHETYSWLQKIQLEFQEKQTRRKAANDKQSTSSCDKKLEIPQLNTVTETTKTAGFDKLLSNVERQTQLVKDCCKKYIGIDTNLSDEQLPSSYPLYPCQQSREELLCLEHFNKTRDEKSNCNSNSQSGGRRQLVSKCAFSDVSHEPQVFFNSAMENSISYGEDQSPSIWVLYSSQKSTANLLNSEYDDETYVNGKQRRIDNQDCCDKKPVLEYHHSDVVQNGREIQITANKYSNASNKEQKKINQELRRNKNTSSCSTNQSGNSLHLQIDKRINCSLKNTNRQSASSEKCIRSTCYEENDDINYFKKQVNSYLRNLDKYMEDIRPTNSSKRNRYDRGKLLHKFDMFKDYFYKRDIQFDHNATKSMS